MGSDLIWFQRSLLFIIFINAHFHSKTILTTSMQTYTSSHPAATTEIIFSNVILRFIRNESIEL